jgi:hypothetical protein
MKSSLNETACSLCIVFCLISHNLVVAQSKDLFRGVQFDSSYCIVGLCQGYDGKLKDSLPQFWFYLDDPADMTKLENEWIFKKIPGDHSYERTSIDITIVKDKRLAQPGCLIYPNRGILISNGGWYHFDTTLLVDLHRRHPLRYHTEKRRFESFNQYAAYGNSVLFDTSLLFFFEPSMQYDGEFDLIANRTNDPDSPIFALADVTKELKEMAPANSFQAGQSLTDSFNINNRSKTKITVKSSKTLYDKFHNKRYIKTAWRPSLVEMKLFWKD